MRLNNGSVDPPAASSGRNKTYMVEESSTESEEHFPALNPYKADLGQGPSKATWKQQY